MSKKHYCCEKCGGKIEDIRIPYNDKRVNISLMRCSDCGDILLMFISFGDDFPFSEGVKIRDEMVKKYGLDITN